MPRAILDEKVSLQVAQRLVALDYEVSAIAKHPERGMNDERVFSLVTEDSSLLITRDTHFTNPVRFPPAQTRGILYITPGNLRGQEEAELVDQFLRSHHATAFAGRLVFLSPSGVTIR
jgi:predicted nuclease of predicted toxin-antitoxin system